MGFRKDGGGGQRRVPAQPARRLFPAEAASRPGKPVARRERAARARVHGGVAGWSLLGISLLLGVIDFELSTGPDWRPVVFAIWILVEVIFFVLWVAFYSFHLDTPSRFACDDAGFGFRFGRSKTRAGDGPTWPKSSST